MSAKGKQQRQQQELQRQQQQQRTAGRTPGHTKYLQTPRHKSPVGGAMSSRGPRVALAVGVALLVPLVASLQAISATPKNEPISFAIRLNEAGQIVIPGLYSRADLVTPIQGERQFAELVLGQGLASWPANETRPQLARLAANQTISLVQFYMATCPDCQGFSPYFKRFARDLSPHWAKLITIYVVNCNDMDNIHLCQKENPKLVVPTVRWYAPPVLQRDLAPGSAFRNQLGFRYASSLLNVAHRQFIEKQRRDLTSLRRATLGYASLMLNGLATWSTAANRSDLRQSTCAPVFEVEAATKLTSLSPDQVLAGALAQPWHSLDQLGACKRNETPGDAFVGDLNDRMHRCLRQLNETNASVGPTNYTILNYIVFEPARSHIGRLLVADWSNYTCASRVRLAQNRWKAFMVHHTSDLSLLPKSVDENRVDDSSGGSFPRLFVFELDASAPVSSLDDVSLRPLAANRTTGGAHPAGDKHHADRHRSASGQSRERRHSHAEPEQKRPERLSQRASLQRYYTRSQPFRYASSMTNSESRATSRHLRRRRRASLEGRARAQAEAEHVNWVPQMVYPDEERLRYEFNRHILRFFGGSNRSLVSWPGSLHAGRHPEEILSELANATQVVPAHEDDLKLLMLTDYYKALFEVLHVDLLSKGELDGLQLLANLCFVRDLARHFPFQGNALAAHKSLDEERAADSAVKSLSRHYIRLVHHDSVELFKRRYEALFDGPRRAQGPQLARDCLAPLGNLTQHKRATNKTDAADGPAPGELERLADLRVPIAEVEAVQQAVQRRHDLGIPSTKHYKWQYCAGSSAYLRGHTCSLWLLFHTMTVHEYLEAGPLAAAKPNASQQYDFQIDYSKPARRACDPASPDEALIGSKTSDLFRRETRFVLANVINFVRFYLPCTNCAAHFSCMVEHSPGLDFGEPRADAHLLWLWEAHNRVNERTRATHSEDPTRPKHIFPVFKACPSCYLEQPAANATFASMRFDRPELVRFLVRRYRRSALLHNRVNIEDLYRKPA